MYRKFWYNIIHYRVVVGNQVGKAYEFINGVIWSGNGRTYVYDASDSGKSLVVTGKKESNKYDGVQAIAVS